ncbi:hypothetical protein DM01DRAFT_1336422 [Hesseltinella vesiculosa]|uniref:Trichome birefringence-like C-terminal domain-containing protein n=1 Tax=Hesseltinella vesiculosa TaxID=101127 RepID=A0A1X2GGR6_9FUNG|nr:hypothetical protein DM01DRAFT_1336422 [Hesseltinella vesiculosa]
MGTSSPAFRSTVVYIITVTAIITSLIFIWAWRDSNLLLPEPHEYLPDPSESLDFVMRAPSHSLQCSSDTFNVGSWVRKPLYLENDSPQALEKAKGYFCNWNFPHKCYRRKEGNEFNRSISIANYAWEPSACSLIQVDKRKLTDHLADHPLLMVGDSITQLQFETLACTLGQDMTGVRTDTNLTGGNTKAWAGQRVHNRVADQPGAVTLAYLRSDYLVRLDDYKLMEPFDDEGFMIGKGSNFAWIHALPKFEYIVINTGPHWHQDLKWGPNKSDEELIAAFTKGMRVVFDYLKTNLASHQRLWVRSTPYGHAKCSQYKKPSTDATVPKKNEGEYQWDLLEKFDLVWKVGTIDKKKPQAYFSLTIELD